MKATEFQTRLMDLQPNMLSFAYSLTKNHEDALDLVQDTTLKVLANEDKFIDNVNFKGWVLTIMRNIFINQYRMSTLLTVVHDESDDFYYLNIAHDSTASSPEDLYSTLEITAAIRNLEPMYRKPFVMLVSGYKYEEISREMNIPQGTVKSRVHYVRQLLKQQFSDYRQ